MVMEVMALAGTGVRNTDSGTPLNSDPVTVIWISLAPLGTWTPLVDVNQPICTYPMFAAPLGKSVASGGFS